MTFAGAKNIIKDMTENNYLNQDVKDAVTIALDVMEDYEIFLDNGKFPMTEYEVDMALSSAAALHKMWDYISNNSDKFTFETLNALYAIGAEYLENN